VSPTMRERSLLPIGGSVGSGQGIVHCFPSDRCHGPMDNAWSYGVAPDSATSCGGGVDGSFIVDVQQPLGGFTSDIGPNELGGGGSGVDSYTDAGTFSLAIDSDCQWSITIRSSAPASTPAPQAPAPKVFTGMAPTPDGHGYWIVDSQGDVYPEGDAVSHGSMTGQHLNAPIAHVVATPDGGGYWMVASDGGIVAFGDAPFYGSMVGHHLNAPVVGRAPTPDGHGYWLVASDAASSVSGMRPSRAPWVAGISTCPSSA
jgi:hypothetical protein